MFTELFKGASPDELKTKMNDYFEKEDKVTMGRLRIENVQQFVIGQVEKATVHISGQPNVTYSFCLLVTFYYEQQKA